MHTVRQRQRQLKSEHYDHYYEEVTESPDRERILLVYSHKMFKSLINRDTLLMNRYYKLKCLGKDRGGSRTVESF